MRRIGEIWRNNGEAVATLQPPAPGVTTVEQRAALLDGCLQLITAAAGAADGSTDTSLYLPTRVERVHSAAGAAEGGWALARSASPADASPGEIRADVYRFDVAGRLLIALQGVSLTRLDGATALPTSGVSPEPFVYTLHWAQSVSPAAPVAAGPPVYAGQQARARRPPRHR
jgi:hypothetical protein